MSVAFRELGGSPVETYSLDGFQARREFLVAWEDREAFAAELLGVASPYGASAWARYPGKDSVYAVHIRFEPSDPADPDPQTLASPDVGLNSYSHSHAKAIVDYRTLTPRDRDDGPSNESGTQLTYRMAYGLEPLEIAPGGWKWVDEPSIAVSTDAPLIRSVAYTDHHLTWHQVVRPPWTAIRQLQGKINSDVLLGCDAGTILFVGAEASKLFRSDLASGASPFCWQLHYLFRERAIKQGGRVLGWNYAYRPNPAGWAELTTTGSDRMYDSADLSALFVSGS
jgi:hypothetical protein